MAQNENDIQFHTQQFDGPLDLLLGLVAKNKMSLYEIEILTLIDQYLAAMGTLRPSILENASAFIEMAAHLVQMKSFLLLPTNEEGHRLQQELRGLLVEYSVCKQMAFWLGKRCGNYNWIVRAPLDVSWDNTYTGTGTLTELADAYTAMIGRAKARRIPDKEQFEEIVAAPFVSVGSRIYSLLRSLVTDNAQKLKILFQHCCSRGETVATFLALLELVKGGRISIDPAGSLVLQRKNREKLAENLSTDVEA